MREGSFDRRLTVALHGTKVIYTPFVLGSTTWKFVSYIQVIYEVLLIWQSQMTLAEPSEENQMFNLSSNS